jgi:hypothetical protein
MDMVVLRALPVLLMPPPTGLSLNSATIVIAANNFAQNGSVRFVVFS